MPYKEGEIRKENEEIVHDVDEHQFTSGNQRKVDTQGQAKRWKSHAVARFSLPFAGDEPETWTLDTSDFIGVEFAWLKLPEMGPILILSGHRRVRRGDIFIAQPRRQPDVRDDGKTYKVRIDPENPIIQVHLRPWDRASIPNGMLPYTAQMRSVGKSKG